MKTLSHAFPITSKGHHGSVLIFVVVLLSVLALLSATTLFIVRQGNQVSQNASQSVESKLAADTGLRHATKVLRDSISTASVFTAEGVFGFDPLAPGNGNDHPWLKKTDPFGVAAPLAAPFASPLRLFADDPVSPDPESISLSVLDSELDAFRASYPSQLYADLRYTSSPILSQVPNQYEFALANRIIGETATFYKGEDAAFTKDKFKAKPLNRLSGIRGQYYVWIKDLDSKLYAQSAEMLGESGWDLDVHRTLDNLPTGTFEEDWKNTIREGVLNYDSGDADYPPLGESVTLAELYDLALSPQAGFSATAPLFHAPNELATRLPSLYDLTDPLDVQFFDKDTYSQKRAELDHYFTIYKDVRNVNSPLLQKRVKDHPTAININTASVEVIAAALSQIPGQNDPDGFPEDHTIIATDRCLALAKRIVSKRPFLCRMDFEDFLAAHLWGECVFDVFGQVTSVDYPPPTAPAVDLASPTEQEFIYDLTGGNVSIARLVYYAIGRRWGRGYTPVAPPVDPLSTPDLNAYRVEDIANYSLVPEITLSQYLEIPGVPEPVYSGTTGPEQFAMKVSLTDWYWPNEPFYQKKRFEFFVNDTQGSDLTVTRNQAQITTREFNNILNSISGINQTAASDDIQIIEVGKKDLSIPPNPVIQAGPNGVLESIAQGDDTFIQHIAPGANGVLDTVVLATSDDYLFNGKILPGANGIFDSVLAPDDIIETDTSAIWPGLNEVAESYVAGTKRPSYYCYTNDNHYAERFWEEIDDALTAHAATLPKPPQAFFDSTNILDPLIRTLSVPLGSIFDADREAARHMRMYYRLPLQSGNSVPTPPVAPFVEFATIGHLVSWRCMPRNDELPGFYQMSFDDWSTFNTYAIGPIQAMGDAYWYNDGFEDDDDTIYSAARPWSGRIIPNLTFDLDPNDPIPPEINVGNGDVSWGPKFAFRSRFFSIFVLGQGMAAPGLNVNAVTQAELDEKFQKELSLLKAQGEKRIEAVYDALLDQIIWQRSPVTDKRAMGEPPPP